MKFDLKKLFNKSSKFEISIDSSHDQKLTNTTIELKLVL